MDDAAEQEQVRAWVQAEADKHFGGDFAAALRAIATAAWRREQEPSNPWAELDARIESTKRKS